MKQDLAFHYQRCVPISNIVKDETFFTISTKSVFGFIVKLENKEGLICTAYLTKNSPVVFLGETCRTKKLGDWVVLWIIGDRALNNDESPYIVQITSSATIPSGAHTFMLEVKESEAAQENADLATRVPKENMDLATPPEKIDAPSPPISDSVPCV